MARPVKVVSSVPDVVTYDESWEVPTPCFVKHYEGTLMVLETVRICPDCGQLTMRCRMAYRWAGTPPSREDPEILGSMADPNEKPGDSVKHYYTICDNYPEDCTWAGCYS